MRLTNVDHNFKEWYTRRGMIHLRQWEACHATGGTSNHKHGVLAKGHSFWIVDLQFGCQNGNVHHSFLATSFYMIPPCCLVYIYSVVHLFWKNICYTHVFHHIFHHFIPSMQTNMDDTWYSYDPHDPLISAARPAEKSQRSRSTRPDAKVLVRNCGAKTELTLWLWLTVRDGKWGNGP